MIDQTIVRGTQGNARFAHIRLKIDGSKLLSEYAMEVIRTQTRISMVEAFSKDWKPEEAIEKIATRIIKMFADVVMNRVKQEMKDVVGLGPEAFVKLVEEVMVGQAEESADGGESHE